jgi:hypothetical protein
MTPEEEARHNDRAAAQRASFEDVPPTCQDVADVLGVLAERYGIAEADVDFARKMIKRLATGRLREALIDATARAIRAERAGTGVKQ